MKVSNQTHRYEALLNLRKQDRVATLRSIKNRSEKRIDSETYQKYAFISSILYHPYARSTRDIFIEPKQNAAFLARLNRAFEKALETINKNVGYVLINKALNMQYNAPHEVMIDTGNYQIVKPVPYLGIQSYAPIP